MPVEKKGLRKMLLPFSERGKLQAEQDWFGAGEGRNMSSCVTCSVRDVYEISRWMSSWQFEVSFQIAKSGIVSFHPSEKGNENKGEEWARRLLRIR